MRFPPVSFAPDTKIKIHTVRFGSDWTYVTGEIENYTTLQKKVYTFHGYYRALERWSNV
jgi:hypothetical protein